MQLHSTIESVRSAVLDRKAINRTICLVPTMGNLHQGHLSLVEHAKTIADEVVVSIFVNPLQFGANEDIDTYPRTFIEDQEKLNALEVGHLFAPTVSEMYPEPENEFPPTQVTVPGLSEILCGESRPTHFSGVTTVVTMLFNIIQPDSAVFGRKDYQQLAVIRKMVMDLCIPVEIIGCPIVREPDGLAMSSRNNYLTESERLTAPKLNQVLQNLAGNIRSHSRNYPALESAAVQELLSHGFLPDYLSVRNAHTLQPATPPDRRLVIVAAAHLGKPRLLDNIEVTLGDSL